MSNHKAWLYACLFIALTACSKKEFAPVTDDPNKKADDICACDLASPEYIRGNFNNTDVCFSTTANATDTFSNAYYRDTAVHLDHINLIRLNINKTMSCEVHFVNTDLHNKTLPFVLPHANPAYNEYAEIVLSDMNKLWATNIDEDYIGSTYKGFSITITDTSGGFFRGIFSGVANTKHGKKIDIENGIFYMHVIDVNKN